MVNGESHTHHSLFTTHYPLLHLLSTKRHISSGLPFFNSSGNRSCAQFCQLTGRTKRFIAPVPTEVKRPSEVAGKGPPCCMECTTSTPVGTLFIITRPAMLVRFWISDLCFGKSVSSATILAVSCPCNAFKTC